MTPPVVGRGASWLRPFSPRRHELELVSPFPLGRLVREVNLGGSRGESGSYTGCRKNTILRAVIARSGILEPGGCRPADGASTQARAPGHQGANDQPTSLHTVRRSAHSQS